jgi:hypothetical protein
VVSRPDGIAMLNSLRNKHGSPLALIAISFPSILPELITLGIDFTLSSSKDSADLPAGSTAMHRALTANLDASACILFAQPFVIPELLHRTNSAGVSSFDCIFRWNDPMQHSTVMKALRSWSKQYPDAVPKAEEIYNKKTAAERREARKRKVRALENSWREVIWSWPADTDVSRSLRYLVEHVHARDSGRHLSAVLVDVAGRSAAGAAADRVLERQRDTDTGTSEVAREWIEETEDRERQEKRVAASCGVEAA